MSVPQPINAFEVETFRAMESCHQVVFFGHISDKNVQGTGTTNQRCPVAFATFQDTPT